MTENEKCNRFLDAQEHPEKYTDSELDEILADSRCIANLKRALMEEKAAGRDVDVDAEWARFSARHRSSRSSRRWVRVAAMFVGFVLVVGVAFAAMTRLGVMESPFSTVNDAVPTGGDATSETRQAVGAKENPDGKADTIAMTQGKTGSATKVYDNVDLATILGEIGEYYGVKVVFANPASRSIRLHFEWDKTKSLDETVRVLNSFRQISLTIRDGAISVE